MRTLTLFEALFLALALNGCGGDDDDTAGGEGEGEDGCQRDEVDAPEDAVSLPAETETEGYVCPDGDQDYYAVSIPDDNLLLRVKLVLEAPLSPVQASYIIYDTAGNLQRKGGVLPAGQQLDEVSCLEAGDYVVMVHDEADDAIDFRHPYKITVNTEPEPDTGEGDEASRTLALNGTPQTGRISCVGDTDRFNIDVPADTLLEVRLTSEVATYEPSFRILDADGNYYFGAANVGGSVTPTDIGGIYALPVAGQYIIEVADDTSGEEDTSEADAAVPYTIEATAHPEPDSNDHGTRNDFADNGTSIGAKSCGGSWASETFTGYLASIGDVDWYRVPLGSCGGSGIMEVSLDLGGAQGLDPQIRVVREFAGKTCDRDEECGDLEVECEDDLSCSGIGNICVGAVGNPRDDDFVPGSCQGAAACLPGQICGTTQIEKNAPAPATTLATSVPLLRGGDTAAYVVVQDFHSDANDLDSPYTLTIRTRANPDAFEQDNLYNPYPHRIVSRSSNLDFAQGPFGIGFTATGTIATEGDEDWFYFTNPCVGAFPDTCQMNVNMNFDAGPVDFVATLVRGREDWFQTAVTDEGYPSNTAAWSGSYGPGGECLFSVAGDDGYYLLVFDNQGNSDNPQPADFSDTQQYHITVTGSTTPSCPAPCVMHVAPDDPGCNVN